GPENDPGNTPTILAAYDHHGVAITASSGDDGWYGWDHLNDGSVSDGVPSSPASFTTVIGVGGTSLFLNANSSRAGEEAWNTNGPSDLYGANLGAALGAAGSGCSTLFAAERWQRFVAGYAALGCGATLRSGVDIAADADPFTGYDVYQDYGNISPTWETVGGTSLASPLIAAMWALAGGPRGVTYPSLSLYGHFKGDRKRPTYDVTIGGTGLCGSSAPNTCLGFWGGNPNEIGAGFVDCAFGASGAAVRANRYQCAARAGYDGVSGVGTPVGVNVFKPDGPKAVITAPATTGHGVSVPFSGARSRDPFPGGSITTYAWNWGDGHTTTTSHPTATHVYLAKGKHTVTLTVTDNYGREGTATRTITVS
ncbi:MAG TPA: PKD domain-containing protein, partial [Actinomycetota bacterium]|nr:PKD domain-containing protein [Actinomycetota bacterium]